MKTRPMPGPRHTATCAAPAARVWRLHLADGALAFELGRVGVDQVLTAKPGAVRPRGPVAHRGSPDVEH